MLNAKNDYNPNDFGEKDLTEDGDDGIDDQNVNSYTERVLSLE